MPRRHAQESIRIQYAIDCRLDVALTDMVSKFYESATLHASPYPVVVHQLQVGAVARCFPRPAMPAGGVTLRACGVRVPPIHPELGHAALDAPGHRRAVLEGRAGRAAPGVQLSNPHVRAAPPPLLPPFHPTGAGTRRGTTLTSARDGDAVTWHGIRMGRRFTARRRQCTWLSRAPSGASHWQ